MFKYLRKLNDMPSLTQRTVAQIEQWVKDLSIELSCPELKVTSCKITLPEEDSHNTSTPTQVMILVDIDKQPITTLNHIRNELSKQLRTHFQYEEHQIHIGFTGTQAPFANTKARATLAVNNTTPVKEAQKEPQSNTGKRGIPGVRHTIVVASGKGGVGKSTVAYHLALALSRLGLKTGLLDADIYGPSLSVLTQINSKPDVTSDKRLIPHYKHTLALMSMGYILNQDQPVIWRGPMVQGALQQLLFEVDWSHQSALDVLIIDTPPGTGDVHLTLAQQLDISGAIIVSTPQDMALIDALKACEMFKKLNTPILGLLENMSMFCCPNCGHETPVFSTQGAKQTAVEKQIPFLGAIPLSADIRFACDNGIPITIDAITNAAHALIPHLF